MSETRPAVAPHPMSIQVGNLPPPDAVLALIEHACKQRMSDLFFTTDDNSVGIAGRHLGVMQVVSRLTADHGRRCIAHIKAMANMDMTERRRPLDGRWVFRRSEDTVDLRINSLPTLHGEDMTLRILDRQTRSLALDRLGMLPHDYNQLLSWLSSPSGLILVTGPTGAGKTTTLYACLGYLNNGMRKLNTIEDPIEYAVAGIRQSQVNPAVDVGFAELLRSVLRQAPDVIMVGEVRDPETAETAVRAANSGHLVLATLHAPVAAGAIQSMLSLGVHPHFLASSLIGVVAQRLIRVLCNECKEAFDLSDAPHTFDEVRKWLEPGQGEKLYNPKGCAGCRGLGFVDRTGVFELLTVTKAIRRLIMERQPMQVIRHKAIEEGMIEFRLSALLKMARGDTSFAEVFRAIPSEYLVMD
jgi:type II secretory ATPase GspE/PulE/Tfp pilus assembly ATPase PilB-like protein